MKRDLAIDLGTANTLVWARGQGIVFNEPSVIAVNARSGAVLGMGRESYNMVQRSPGQIITERPLRGGTITDFGTTSRMLEMALKRCGATRFNKPKVLICVPTDITPVERRAMEGAARQAGASHAILIQQPMAAAIGAQLPVQEPVGNMVVDIGGGTSEVAVVSLGGVVTAKTVRVGGFDIDAAIQTYIRDHYGVAIGENTAEELKIELGSAYPQTEEPKAEIRGRELASGLPKTMVVGAAEIREAIDDQVMQIQRTVTDTLADCPPELTQDVLRNGMWLVGGGAMLRGLDARLSHETHVKVNIIANPMDAVVLGAGTMLESFTDLKALQP